MALFSAFFPNVRDENRTLAAAREIAAVGAAGAAAAVIAKAVGFAAIKINPLNALVYCTTAALVDAVLGNVIRETAYKYLAPKGMSSAAADTKISIAKASDAIAKVIAIALTTLAIATFLPSLSVGAMTGLLTCAAALTLNALFDASVAKLRGL